MWRHTCLRKPYKQKAPQFVDCGAFLLSFVISDNKENALNLNGTVIIYKYR